MESRKGFGAWPLAELADGVKEEISELSWVREGCEEGMGDAVLDWNDDAALSLPDP